MGDAGLAIVQRLFHSVKFIRNALTEEGFHNGQISARFYLVPIH